MDAVPTPTAAAASLARAGGLDLTTVTGTGTDGRVLVADVEAALAEAARAAEEAGPQTLGEGEALTFDAPGHLGGVRVTVQPGETVAPSLARHIPAVHRERFSPAS